LSFTLTESYTDLMIPKDTYKPVEFSLVKPWLTPKAQREWDAVVTTAWPDPARPTLRLT
jgi:hypothetical protein